MSEPKFVPKPGQVDYTDIRYAPVCNVVVARAGKILLVKRSADRLLYPNCWAAIAGFLDDSDDIETKAYEELREELGIRREQVFSLKRGPVIVREDPAYGKTWLIVTMLATVTTDKFTLDWEASEARWFAPEAIAGLDVMPGTLAVIEQFSPEVAQK